jgi:mercuric ion transport protein
VSGNREGAALAGVGVAACAVCCAGPILGVLAAIGLGTVAGAMVFGVGVLVVGALVATMVIVRRRRRVAACTVNETDVPVQMSAARSVQ